MTSWVGSSLVGTRRWPGINIAGPVRSPRNTSRFLPLRTDCSMKDVTEILESGSPPRCGRVGFFLVCSEDLVYPEGSHVNIFTGGH